MGIASSDEILDRIRVEIKAVVPDVESASLDLDVYIAEVGISSVQMLEMVAQIENHFGLTLPDYELSGVDSIGDLVRVIARSQAEAL